MDLARYLKEMETHDVGIMVFYSHRADHFHTDRSPINLTDIHRIKDIVSRTPFTRLDYRCFIS